MEKIRYDAFMPVLTNQLQGSVLTIENATVAVCMIFNKIYMTCEA